METLSAIKLEEMARAVIAEAIYRKKGRIDEGHAYFGGGEFRTKIC